LTRFCSTIFPSGVAQTPDKSTRNILKLNLPQPLWTPGSVFPAPGSHIVQLPFRLQLPEDIAPSFADAGRVTARNSSAASLSAQIAYVVTVRGERQGVFRRARQLERSIHIVTASKPGDIAIKSMLNSGPWTGSWQVLTTQTSLSDGGLARAELTVPEVSSFPANTSVPYRLRILTQSRQSSRTDTVEVVGLADVPTSAAEVKMSLVRTLNVRAGHDKASISTSNHPSSITRNTVFAPRYVGENGSESSEKGAWQRSSSFEGTLVFSGSPSFTAKDVSTSYTLRLQASIPGTKSTLSSEWPIDLTSGVEAAPPAFDFDLASPLQYATPTMTSHA
jgi:hypothetical protein